jgi:hypothetical protein
MDYLEFEDQPPPQLQLEDFFDKHVDSIPAEEKLERLGLRVSVQNRSGVSVEKMYTVAVQNLRKLAPNLCEVNLIGGYVFRPQKPVSQVDAIILYAFRTVTLFARKLNTWHRIFGRGLMLSLQRTLL